MNILLVILLLLFPAILTIDAILYKKSAWPQRMKYGYTPISGFLAYYNKAERKRRMLEKRLKEH